MESTEEKGRYKFQNEARKYDELRKQYISEQEPVKYAQICNEYNYTPEDQELYDEGIAWLVHQEEKKQKRKYQGYENGKEFYRVAKDYSRDFGVDTELKEKSLKNHFRKFQAGGKQDLRNHEPPQIDTIFKNTIETYENMFGNN